MKTIAKNIFLGVIFLVLLGVIFYLWKRDAKDSGIQQGYYILSNQIQHLNKMIVVEQDFSSFQTHKGAAASIAGYAILPKEMVLYTTAKAQVTYDLGQMQIEVDSLQKKLLISSLPEPEVKIFPQVKMHFMEDSFANRYTKNEINAIQASAIKNIENQIDQKQLKAKAHQQLLQNLNNIFVLAKSLGYTIEDQSGEVKILL